MHDDPGDLRILALMSFRASVQSFRIVPEKFWKNLTKVTFPDTLRSWREKRIV